MNCQMFSTGFSSGHLGGKLAEKIAGEAGKAIGENVVDGAKDILGPAAERTTDFLISLLKGDGGTAARIAVSKTIV
jgi:hypothetical protein